MISSTYEAFCKLNIDRAAIGLGKSEYDVEYFCTPVGAEVIGYEGVDGIHYCFIPEYGDVVFAVNPMPAVDEHVYPLAKNFEDFLSLIITCNSTAAVEQIIGWDNKEIFDKYVQPCEDEYGFERQIIFKEIKDTFDLDWIEDPYGYVRELQKDFDYSKIKYSEEYYDILGLEIPSDIKK